MKRYRRRAAIGSVLLGLALLNSACGEVQSYNPVAPTALSIPEPQDVIVRHIEIDRAPATTPIPVRQAPSEGAQKRAER